MWQSLIYVLFFIAGMVFGWNLGAGTFDNVASQTCSISNDIRC